ncbi:MAG: hypothetical protein ACUVTZ_02925 [Armatimonadota bacterium]
MNETLPPVSRHHVGVSLAPRPGDKKLEQVPFFAVHYSSLEDAQTAVRALEGSRLRLAIEEDQDGFRYVVEREPDSKDLLSAIIQQSGRLWEYKPDATMHEAFLDALRTARRWFLIASSDNSDSQAVIESRRFTLRFSEA